MTSASEIVLFARQGMVRCLGSTGLKILYK